MSPAQTAENRRQQNRAEVRRTILDAAAELAAESGFAGFSMRTLVNRCGYSAPTIYHYFGDKHGLLDALLEESLQDLVADLETVPVFSDPIETVRALTLCFAKWGIDNPTYYHLLTQPRPSDAAPLPSGDMSTEMMTGPLDQLVGEGRLNESELDLLRQSLWACLHGLISLPAVRPDLTWQKDLLESSVDVILRGWLSQTEERRRKEGGLNTPAKGETEGSPKR